MNPPNQRFANVIIFLLILLPVSLILVLAFGTFSTLPSNTVSFVLNALVVVQVLVAIIGLSARAFGNLWQMASKRKVAVSSLAAIGLVVAVLVLMTHGTSVLMKPPMTQGKPTPSVTSAPPTSTSFPAVTVTPRATVNPFDPANAPYNWQSSDDANLGSCQYSAVDGSYHIKTDSYYYQCMEGLTYSNFTMRVQANIVSGSACDVLFRADTTGHNLYILILGIDNGGEFELQRVKNGNKSTIAQGTVAFVQHRTYTFTITARGNSISLLLDQIQLASVQDNAVASGLLGLAADGGPGEAIFTNFSVQSL